MKKKIILYAVVYIILASFVFAADDVWITPFTMTSNILPAPYKASEYKPYNSNYYGYKVFDKTTSKYQTIGSLTYGWVILDLGAGNDTIITKYQVDGSNAAPESPLDWTLQGSDDNVTWNTIDTETGINWIADEKKNFSVDIITTAYRYFKYNVTAVNGAEIGFKELNYFSNTTPGADSINISEEIFPANNTQYSYQTLNFNTSINASNITDCQLYINNTFNQTTSYAAGQNVVVSFNETLANGDWTFYIFCNDSMTSNETTAMHEFYVDSTLPTIGWHTPSALNNTVMNGTLNTSIDLYDLNLYAYYFNITWPNGTLVPGLNYTNTSLTGLTNKQITNAPNMYNYSGVFNAVVRVCDGHTAQSIEPFDVKVYSNRIAFDDVYIKSLLFPPDKISYLKLDDKYTFSFKYPTPRTEIQIQVPDYCDYIGSKTNYLGHFVCGNKWVDFEGMYTVNVFQNIITVKSKKPLILWEFNSIGELNCVESETEFFVVNHTVGYTSDVLANRPTTIYFNMTYNSSWINNTEVKLYYNNTEYTMTESCGTTKCQYSKIVTTPNATNNISFAFNYTFQTFTENTTTYTQEVYLPLIDNCSSHTERWVNFSIKDELNSSALTGNINYLLSWDDGYYSNSETGISTFSFCLWPAWANFTTDITLQYLVSGYDQRDYIQKNYAVNNISKNVSLYALTTTDSIEITIHVIDDNDNNLEGIIIEAYRWDISSETENLIESKTTDSEGNALFSLKTNSEYYKFLFYKEGEIELTTSRFQIYSTILEYVLADIDSTALQEWLQINSITHDLIYTESTNLIAFTWNDASGIADSFCLNITDFNQTYLSNCSSASSGTMHYTITQFNRTYVAHSKAKHTASQNWYTLDQLSINTYDKWSDHFGIDDAITFGWLIFTFIALIFVDNKNAAIVGSCGALLVLYFFGALPDAVGITIIIGICVVGVIAMYIMNKRPSFQ